MLGLIALQSKVQVMLNEVGLVRSELDLEFELTPSFFCDPERRLGEGYIQIHRSAIIFFSN